MKPQPSFKSEYVGSLFFQGRREESLLLGDFIYIIKNQTNAIFRIG